MKHSSDHDLEDDSISNSNPHRQSSFSSNDHQVTKGIISDHQDVDPDPENVKDSMTSKILNPEQDRAPDGGLESWSVVVASFLLYFVAFGNQNSAGVFQTYYLNEWKVDGELRPLASASQISWALSMQVFITYLSSGLTGLALNKVSAKIILLIGLFIFVLSLELLSLSTDYWSVFLTQGLLQGIGTGMLFTPALSCTSQYFDKHRGLALGVVAAGSSVGGVVWPIVMDRLIHDGPGFSWAVRIVGFISLGIGLIASLFVKKRLDHVKETPFFDLEAFHSKGFVLLMIGQFIIYFGLFWEYYYLPAIGGIQGMPSGSIFYLASASNGSSLIGRIVSGLIGDSFGRFDILIISTIACSIIVYSTIAAVHLTGSSITAPLFLIASFYGFASGAFFTCQTVVVTQFSTDQRKVGTWIGMLYAIVSIPALFGPPIGATIFQNHGFPPALIFSATVIMGGAGFLTMSRLSVETRLNKRI